MSLFLTEKISGEAPKGLNLQIGNMSSGRTDHFDSLFQCKQGPLAHMMNHRYNYIFKHPAGSFKNIYMAICNRVKTAWIDCNLQIWNPLLSAG